MARFLFALAVGLVGAAIVHIAVIFAIPRVAENNAWGRLARIGAMNEPVRIDPLQNRVTAPATDLANVGSHDFAFVDPAFATVSCRFSLANGPVHMIAAGSTDFWSASIYSAQGDNLYSINDRSAVRDQFDLMVGTTEQLLEARANSADRDETSIPVEVNIVEGYLTLRALIDEKSQAPSVDTFMRSLRCISASG